ncbi:hypothetical protein GCK72_019984 [Caenorhabditis remanei]|uniref:Acyl carrier protein n=1 Tax=Caenorhabditis remanei TaxID=31234 RepID=A0A6A5GDW7_CAERE|nr:hypothetical protein GCK72_019984 [Caenorhabditis remanei]KAF1753427.1 hypothetical protein GCK72_019984 [Caenorhabditis remanei]
MVLTRKVNKVLRIRVDEREGFLQKERILVDEKVEIVMALEDEFGFEIQLQDSDKLKSIRDAFKYICEREDVYE